jgi:hypothetical protein
MKKITLSLFAVACSLSSGFSQIVLQEGFTAIFNPVAAGWSQQNESTNLGTNPVWFQGNPNVFSAFDGAIDDYFACNFNSVATGDISNWLITPVVTIYNGAVFQFATTTAFTGTDAAIPDRLQVRMSTAGVSSSVTPGSGPTSVGTFTNLLLDINPNLNGLNASAVVSGSVNGYPQAWTVYSLQVTGVTGTVTGKFAFRYFVTNGGPSGANSSYIGIDAVKYTLPCEPTVQSFTTCVGTNVTLSALGLPATTYSWSTGSTSPSITVNPSSTQVYTLFPGVNGGLCPNVVTATVTVASALGVNVASSASIICSGSTVTLTATSSASTYSWSNGATSAIITVTPNTTTTYSVGAISGLCVGGNTITVIVNASPNITYSINPSPICLGSAPPNLTVTTSGASTYTYVFANGTATVNPISLITPTTAGVRNFDVFGTAPNGCISGGTATFAVNPNPTITITSSLAACVNSTVSLTASGASTYSWSGAGTGTTNPLSSPTGSTALVKTYTVVGTATTGCSASAVRTVSISLCTGIENIFGNSVETSVFPNPFTNELQISGLDGFVKVYNALGQLVFGIKVYDTATINTSEFAKGVYILKAYTNQGTELKTTKLIKN